MKKYYKGLVHSLNVLQKIILLKGDNVIYMRRSHGQTSSIFFVSFIIIVITASNILSPILIISLGTKPAFGDGLTQEQMSASLGNRKADLLIKMIPPVVTTETLQKGQKPTVEFRLFDSNTNQSFSHVTYNITVEDKSGKTLLAGLFHDHNGNLKIRINPINTSKISISGGKQDVLYRTGTSANPIIVSGPLFLSGGLYHFIVRIETVDSDYTLLPYNQQPIYDSWLSIGNTENKQISIDGKQIPIKVISYYDKLKDFTFDNKNMQMKFDMPFNWNLTRLNKASIFVHEEVYVPKPNAFSANGSSSSSSPPPPPSYIGKVNGIDVSKSVMVDNTQPDKNVIHVMLPKNTILQLANQVNKNGQQQQQQQQQASNQGLMEFTLQPNPGPASSGSMGSMGSMAIGSMSSGSMGSMS